MPRTRLLLTLGLAALIAAIAPTPRADATVMVEVTLEDLAREADVIARGFIVRTGTQMVLEDGGMEPNTLSFLRVSEYVKGTGEEILTIRERGGVHQNGGMWIDGTPEYRVGEEVVVFLVRHPMLPDHYRTYGMVQGKFVVLRGVLGVPDTVRRDTSSVAFARWADGQMLLDEGELGPVMQLDGFLRVVRDAATLDATTSSTDTTAGGAR